MKKLVTLMTHLDKNKEDGFLQKLTDIEDGIFQKGKKMLEV